jgi:pyruvate dehydrogenase E2 component (dihydrolipoamide acetyltransferase)
MAVPILVPKATITMEEGKLLSWLKSEGERVAKDDLIFELETDKAIVEVPAPADGILLKILRASGAVRPDAVVGWIGEAGERIAAEERVRSTPAARRRAAELGVDLAAVVGTGPGGRITEGDVEKAKPADAVGRPKALVERLSNAWRTAPHIYLARKIDAGPLELARHGGASVTDLLLFALARLLRRYPALCSVWSGESLLTASGMHLAFAVDTERGVIAPVIHNVDRISIMELSTERKKLAESARAGRLSPEQIAGGVFTLTNLGMTGVDFFAPIINHPQTAILAAGRIVQEPVVEDGVIRIGTRAWLNLAVDHRAADGALAGRFLEEFELNLGELLTRQEANCNAHES